MIFDIVQSSPNVHWDILKTIESVRQLHINIQVYWQVWQVYLFYNQKIIDPCGTYIQSQVNTGTYIYTHPTWKLYYAWEKNTNTSQICQSVKLYQLGSEFLKKCFSQNQNKVYFIFKVMNSPLYSNQREVI